MSASLAGDTDDLEALFDSIVAANTDTPAPITAPEPVAAPPVAANADAAEGVACPGMNEPFYSQIGHLTRKLHDTLHDLGLDKSLEKAVDNTIPDARDRLAYIATLTEKAADRVLNATDIAKPLQDQMDAGSAKLSGQWDRLLKNELSIDDFKQLVTDTRGFLGTVTQHSKATNDQLLEIMMAQDFQDLTGQVIKKVIEMAKEMENQLLSLLIQSSSPEKKAEIDTGLLNGPVVNTEGRTDIVTSQEQVDDLLESLGF
ncbi:MAG: protein phosphatase CheZ [Pseudomonadota bacterium]